MKLNFWFLTAPVVAAIDLQQPLTFQPFAFQHLTSQPSKIPSLGFGTWNIDKSNATEAVSAALQAGYRHIDCAKAYGNQKEVGKGIADGLKKIGLDSHTPALVSEALDDTLVELGMGYLDLWLMHWPVGTDSTGNKLDYLIPWQHMIRLNQTNKIRFIGVSNFSPAQFKDIMHNSDAKPDIHQFELHPYLPQTDWIKFHKTHGIGVTGYSPFANTNPTYVPSDHDPPLLLKNKDMLAIAAERGCTTAQVALVWGMSRGYSVIPKSSHVNHIKENYGALKCKLHDGDLDRIDDVSMEYLKRFNNPSKDWGVKLFQGLQDS
ncbi:MAG: hypothetical protein Q9184_001925 [Pyrenodesmia sp. 2 TL-2023]